jgi:mannose-6-phosphate isomerase-like protein (cupin superfamily)
MSEELTIGPGTTLRVVARSEKTLEVEVTYDGGSTPPPPHLHPGQDERFKVVSGAMRTRIGQREETIVAGEELTIPRGTTHQLWNDRDVPAVVNWRTMPAGRTLDWFLELAALQRGEPLKDPGLLLSEYSDVFRLADAG